jgi:DNA-binding MarR family transcriptional regulator
MKRVRLTDAGDAVIRRLGAARLSGLEQFTASLSDSERERLARALSTLLQRPDLASCRPEEALA